VEAKRSIRNVATINIEIANRMALNDQQIEALEKKGFDQEVLNKHERAIFLLQHVSDTIRLDFDEYMKPFGIKGKTSEYARKLKMLNEEYFNSIRDVIPRDQKMRFFKNYETLEKKIRKLTGLDEQARKV